jgi:gas vesicle protein
MTTKSKIALGLAGAIAAGVIIGLAVAPEKGSDTRRKVKDKAGKLMGGLNRLISRSRHNGDPGHQEQRRGKEVSTAMG